MGSLWFPALLLSVFWASGCSAASPGPAVPQAPSEVDDVSVVERAFAETMAKRDLNAFATFLSEEALFVSEARTLRGKQQILEVWKRFFDGPLAPFSWEPTRVEKIDSGTLALSTGPVRDRKGTVVATFTSIWRKEATGWRILFDRGVDLPECPMPSSSGNPSVSATKPDFAAYRQTQAQARAAYDRKDYLTFLTWTQQADQVFPNTPRAVYNLACGHALTGQTKEAFDDLQRLVRMNVHFDITRDDDLASLKKLPAFAEVQDKFSNMAKAVVGTSVPAFTLPERQSIPEGIAYDGQTKSFFVSSVHQRKIVRISPDGKSKDFVTSNLYAVLGMAVDEKRRTLWACSSAVPEMKGFVAADKGQANVVAFDIDSGKARQVIPLSEPNREHVCNDLAIDGEGRLFVADPAASTLLVLTPNTQKLEEFLPPGTLAAPQGIALRPDGKSFYIADYSRGIAHVDLSTRDVRWLVSPTEATFLGVDGLMFYQGDLIAIQNGVRPHRIVRIRLDGMGSTVQRTEILEMNHPQFNEPTLGVIVGQELFYVANSQWGSFDKGVIWPAEKMKEPVILKRRLD